MNTYTSPPTNQTIDRTAATLERLQRAAFGNEATIELLEPVWRGAYLTAPAKMQLGLVASGHARGIMDDFSALELSVKILIEGALNIHPGVNGGAS